MKLLIYIVVGIVAGLLVLAGIIALVGTALKSPLTPQLRVRYNSHIGARLRWAVRVGEQPTAA